MAGLATVLVALFLATVAIGIDTTWRPPLWLQAAIWAPITITVVLTMLRLMKGIGLTSRYRRDRYRVLVTS